MHWFRLADICSQRCRYHGSGSSGLLKENNYLKEPQHEAAVLPSDVTVCPALDADQCSRLLRGASFRRYIAMLMLAKRRVVISPLVSVTNCCRAIRTRPTLVWLRLVSEIP